MTNYALSQEYYSNNNKTVTSKDKASVINKKHRRVSDIKANDVNNSSLDKKQRYLMKVVASGKVVVRLFNISIALDIPNINF